MLAEEQLEAFRVDLDDLQSRMYEAQVTLQQALQEPQGDDAFREGIRTTEGQLKAVEEGVASLEESLQGESIDTSRIKIAVAPLNSPGDEELGFGISDVLASKLSQAENLAVVAPEATRGYRGDSTYLLGVATALGADHVVTGKVVSTGAQTLKINTQLFNVHTGNSSPLWDHQGPLSDSLDAPGQITLRVLDALNWETPSDVRSKISEKPTSSVDAYLAYSKGRYHWSNRPQGLREALKYFNEAVALDPQFALGFSGLADTYVLMGYYGYGEIDRTDAVQHAKEAAERALALDESLAEVHASLGLVSLYEWDWGQAELQLRRSVQLDANYVPAKLWLANILAGRGHSIEAIRLAEEAKALNPFSQVAKLAPGLHYYYARRFAAARAEFERILKEEPQQGAARLQLGLIYAQLSLLDESLSELRHANEELEDSSSLTALGYVYGVAGKKEEAEAILRRLEDYEDKTPVDLAVVHIGLGANDRAFDLLEQAVKEPVLDLMFLRVDPYFDALRKDERWLGLLRDVGLAEESS
jgi:serine/threonine-protein kinase